MKLVLGGVLVGVICLIFVIKLIGGRDDEEDQKEKQAEEEERGEERC